MIVLFLWCYRWTLTHLRMTIIIITTTAIRHSPRSFHSFSIIIIILPWWSISITTWYDCCPSSCSDSCCCQFYAFLLLQGHSKQNSMLAKYIIIVLLLYLTCFGLGTFLSLRNDESLSWSRLGFLVVLLFLHEAGK